MACAGCQRRRECCDLCAPRLKVESQPPWLTLVLAILLGLVCRARGTWLTF